MSSTEIATLKTLASFRSEIEATELANILQDHGIEARAVGGFTSEFVVGTPGGVKVLVHENAFDEARQLMAEIKASTRLDDSTDDDFVVDDSSSFDSENYFKPWSILLATQAGFAGVVLYWAGGGRNQLGYLGSFATFAILFCIILWIGNRNRDASS